MARSKATVIENNFIRGIITEATGLNFPENAATDALNVRFTKIGSIERRKGFDLEGSATAQAYTPSDGIIQEYLWRSVAKIGGVTFLVLQIGMQVCFYELTQSESLSLGLSLSSIDLNDYLAPGASQPHLIPCTFSSGGGNLYIAHPMCDPVFVWYDSDDEVFRSERITIKVRDFEGLEVPFDDTENPSTLSTNHHYNLKNQGWFEDVRVGTVNNEGN